MSEEEKKDDQKPKGPEPIPLSHGVANLIRSERNILNARIENFIKADLAARGIDLPPGPIKLSDDGNSILALQVGGLA